jgi:hypothetical protein
MDEFFRPGVLLTAVLLSALFPLSVWHLYAVDRPADSSPNLVAPPAPEIPFAFRAAEQQFSPQLKQEIMHKRFYAIQTARKTGQQEYTFRVKVPPPPICGQ